MFPSRVEFKVRNRVRIMWKSLTAVTRQVYTCVVRPSISSVNHQAICHMSDDRQNTREDEQRVPDAKDWRLFYPSKETMKLDVDGTAYNQLPVVNIKSTNNNVIISLCKATGDILYCSSAGALGFRNARRKTNLAAQSVGAHIGESALIGLRTSGVRIVSISEVTKIPHNGCRPKRRPRK
uniref:30S ribosomal protein S11 n=1 Tax=Magallana gigas TaxID=29159 RepID=K1Q733_MAGGI